MLQMQQYQCISNSLTIRLSNNKNILKSQNHQKQYKSSKRSSYIAETCGGRHMNTSTTHAETFDDLTCAIFYLGRTAKHSILKMSHN